MSPASGPLLQQLTRRLAETPADLLAEPAIGTSSGVETGAIAGDVLRGLGLINPEARWLASLHPEKADKKQHNFLRVMLVASWLLADPWFRGKAGSWSVAAAAQNWLYGGSIAELAELTTADAFVKDDDRREEFARLCLKALDFLPHGENAAQAQDRLESISSIERNRVITAARKINDAARKKRADEEERARKVREEMQRKAAEAAAAKGTRE
jgi:hypothetical protein